jgi:hypothetical protein
MSGPRRLNALHTWVIARQKFMVLNVRSGLVPGSEQFSDLSVQTLVRFTQQMGGVTKLNDIAAVSLLELISTIPLDDEHRAACIDLVNAKVAGPDDAGGGAGGGEDGPPKQEVPYPELWCTRGDWILLLDPTTVGHARITCVASRFGKAGLLNASETAIKHMTCLLFLDSVSPEAVINQALNAGRVIKGLFLQRARSRDTSDALPTFECTPQEFEVPYPTWFEQRLH